MNDVLNPFDFKFALKFVDASQAENPTWGMAQTGDFTGLVIAAMILLVGICFGVFWFVRRRQFTNAFKPLHGQARVRPSVNDKTPQGNKFLLGLSIVLIAISMIFFINTSAGKAFAEGQLSTPVLKVGVDENGNVQDAHFNLKNTHDYAVRLNTTQVEVFGENWGEQALQDSIVGEDGFGNVIFEGNPDGIVVTNETANDFIIPGDTTQVTFRVASLPGDVARAHIGEIVYISNLQIENCEVEHPEALTLTYNGHAQQGVEDNEHCYTLGLDDDPNSHVFATYANHEYEDGELIPYCTKVELNPGFVWKDDDYSQEPDYVEWYINPAPLKVVTGDERWIYNGKEHNADVLEGEKFADDEKPIEYHPSYVEGLQTKTISMPGSDKQFEVQEYVGVASQSIMHVDEGSVSVPAVNKFIELDWEYSTYPVPETTGYPKEYTTAFNFNYYIDKVVEGKLSVVPRTAELEWASKDIEYTKVYDKEELDTTCTITNLQQHDVEGTPTKDPVLVNRLIYDYTFAPTTTVPAAINAGNYKAIAENLYVDDGEDSIFVDDYVLPNNESQKSQLYEITKAKSEVDWSFPATIKVPNTYNSTATAKINAGEETESSIWTEDGVTYDVTSSYPEVASIEALLQNTDNIVVKALLNGNVTLSVNVAESRNWEKSPVKTVEVTVEPGVFDFVFDHPLPDGLVQQYDGQMHNLGVRVITENVEDVTFHYSLDTESYDKIITGVDYQKEGFTALSEAAVKDVKMGLEGVSAYTVNVKASKPGYNDNTQSSTITINPIIVDVLGFSPTSFIYNGSNQQPEVSIRPSAYVSGETISPMCNVSSAESGTIVSESVNVGTYKKEVYGITVNGSGIRSFNYALNSESVVSSTYSITPKVVGFNWKPSTEPLVYDYDVAKHAPEAKVNTSDIVPGDDVTVSSYAYKQYSTGEITLTDKPNLPGSYNVKVTELNNSNYAIGTADDQNVSKDFKIVVPVTIQWDESQIIFDGKDHTPKPTVIETYDFIDSFDVIIELSGDTTIGVDGNKHAVHGGDYSAEVKSVIAKGSTWESDLCRITNGVHTFTIEKKSISSNPDIDYTLDGEVGSSHGASYTYSGSQIEPKLLVVDDKTFETPTEFIKVTDITGQCEIDVTPQTNDGDYTATIRAKSSSKDYTSSFTIPWNIYSKVILKRRPIEPGLLVKDTTDDAIKEDEAELVAGHRYYLDVSAFEGRFKNGYTLSVDAAASDEGGGVVTNYNAKGDNVNKLYFYAPYSSYAVLRDSDWANLVFSEHTKSEVNFEHAEVEYAEEPTLGSWHVYNDDKYFPVGLIFETVDDGSAQPLLKATVPAYQSSNTVDGMTGAKTIVFTVEVKNDYKRKYSFNGWKYNYPIDYLDYTVDPPTVSDRCKVPFLLDSPDVKGLEFGENIDRVNYSDGLMETIASGSDVVVGSDITVTPSSADITPSEGYTLFVEYTPAGESQKTDTYNSTAASVSFKMPNAAAKIYIKPYVSLLFKQQIESKTPGEYLDKVYYTQDTQTWTEYVSSPFKLVYNSPITSLASDSKTLKVTTVENKTYYFQVWSDEAKDRDLYEFVKWIPTKADDNAVEYELKKNDARILNWDSITANIESVTAQIDTEGTANYNPGDFVKVGRENITVSPDKGKITGPYTLKLEYKDETGVVKPHEYQSASNNPITFTMPKTQTADDSVTISIVPFVPVTFAVDPAQSGIVVRNIWYAVYDGTDGEQAWDPYMINDQLVDGVSAVQVPEGTTYNVSDDPITTSKHRKNQILSVRDDLNGKTILFYITVKDNPYYYFDGFNDTWGTITNDSITYQLTAYSTTIVNFDDTINKVYAYSGSTQPADISKGTSVLSSSKLAVVPASVNVDGLGYTVYDTNTPLVEGVRNDASSTPSEQFDIPAGASSLQLTVKDYETITFKDITKEKYPDLPNYIPENTKIYYAVGPNISWNVYTEESGLTFPSDTVVTALQSDTSVLTCEKRLNGGKSTNYYFCAEYDSVPGTKTHEFVLENWTGWGASLETTTTIDYLMNVTKEVKMIIDDTNKYIKNIDYAEDEANISNDINDERTFNAGAKIAVQVDTSKKDLSNGYSVIGKDNNTKNILFQINNSASGGSPSDISQFTMPYCNLELSVIPYQNVTIKNEKSDSIKTYGSYAVNSTDEAAYNPLSDGGSIGYFPVNSTISRDQNDNYSYFRIDFSDEKSVNSFTIARINRIAELENGDESETRKVDITWPSDTFVTPHENNAWQVLYTPEIAFNTIVLDDSIASITVHEAIYKDKLIYLPKEENNVTITVSAKSPDNGWTLYEGPSFESLQWANEIAGESPFTCDYTLTTAAQESNDAVCFASVPYVKLNLSESDKSQAVGDITYKKSTDTSYVQFVSMYVPKNSPIKSEATTPDIFSLKFRQSSDSYIIYQFKVEPSDGKTYPVVKWNLPGDVYIGDSPIIYTIHGGSVNWDEDDSRISFVGVGENVDEAKINLIKPDSHVVPGSNIFVFHSSSSTTDRLKVGSSVYAFLDAPDARDHAYAKFEMDSSGVVTLELESEISLTLDFSALSPDILVIKKDQESIDPLPSSISVPYGSTIKLSEQNTKMTVTESGSGNTVDYTVALKPAPEDKNPVVNADIPQWDLGSYSGGAIESTFGIKIIMGSAELHIDINNGEINNVPNVNAPVYNDAFGDSYQEYNAGSGGGSADVPEFEM